MSDRDGGSGWFFSIGSHSIRNKWERDLNLMGRRRFLRDLSGFGIASAGMSHVSAEEVTDSADVDEGEVPIVSRYAIDVELADEHDPEPTGKPLGMPDYTPEVRGVPEWKWKRVLAGRDAASRMKRQMEDELEDSSPQVAIRTEDGQKQGPCLDA